MTDRPTQSAELAAAFRDLEAAAREILREINYAPSSECIPKWAVRGGNRLRDAIDQLDTIRSAFTLEVRL